MKSNLTARCRTEVPAKGILVRRLHAKLGLASARDGSGWVGHSGLHSARGSIIGLAFVVAIVIVRLVVH